MSGEVDRVKWLYQEQVVWDIEKRFGSEFTSINDAGNTVIHPAVLKEFRKLPDIVWERGERAWRKRQPSDQPGRQQT